MYYPGSENKGADQLPSYCEAGLRLCFRIHKPFVFSVRHKYFYSEFKNSCLYGIFFFGLRQNFLYDKVINKCIKMNSWLIINTLM